MWHDELSSIYVLASQFEAWQVSHGAQQTPLTESSRGAAVPPCQGSARERQTCTADPAACKRSWELWKRARSETYPPCELDFLEAWLKSDPSLWQQIGSQSHMVQLIVFVLDRWDRIADFVPNQPWGGYEAFRHDGKMHRLLFPSAHRGSYTEHRSSN